MIVYWEPRDHVNEAFKPFFDNTDRYLIFYGGRGSSKSDFVAKKLIYRCLNEKYFRCVLIRNTYATIKDSSYQTIKDIITDLGLEDLFEFKLQPLEIQCVNGNCFIARGCDDTTKLKSIKDPSCVWYEEDIPTESDFITVTTGIRTLKADYLQEVFSINPEVEGNYQDHWFYKRFFLGHDEKSFSSSTALKIDDTTNVNLTYTVHHSTYKDNEFLPPEYVGFLMDLKLKNPYYWEIYCNGNWGNKIFGGLFYKSFSVGGNVMTFPYNPELPLHISFDFNVNPYMTCLISQIVGKSLYIIDEIAMKSPNNRTKDTCREFMRRYTSHKGGLFIYGDPAGRAEATRTEEGFNEYTIITQELYKFRPTLRILSTHPPVKTRGDFINTCLEDPFKYIAIYLFDKSVYMKNDFLFGKEASDGTKHKERYKDDNGVQCEKYHHMSDALDYKICAAFPDEFELFKSGPIGMNWNYKRVAMNSNRI